MLTFFSFSMAYPTNNKRRIFETSHHKSHNFHKHFEMYLNFVIKHKKFIDFVIKHPNSCFICHSLCHFNSISHNLSQLTNSHHILSNNRNLETQISQTSSKWRQILKHATHFWIEFQTKHTICDKFHLCDEFHLHSSCECHRFRNASQKLNKHHKNVTKS